MRATHGMRNSPLSKGLFTALVLLACIVVLVLQLRWMESRRRAELGPRLDVYTRLIEMQTQRVFCDACDGSGLVRHPEQPDQVRVCPVCFGLGMHQVRHLDEQDVLCPRCRGLGRLPGARFDEAVPCETCGGRGLLTDRKREFTIPAKKVQCDHCGGRGVIRAEERPHEVIVCPICFGIGSHLVRRLDDREELCPACGGMGRLPDPDSGEVRFCRNCGGRGLILDAPAAIPPEAPSGVSPPP